MNQFGQQGTNGYHSSMNGSINSSMNSMNRPAYGMNATGQQNQQNQNRYQPSGYVQSHYQGIPKQSGAFSAQSQATPVISQFGQTASQNFHQPMSSKPVISHFGGYQAQQMQQPMQSTTHYVQSSKPITNQFSGTMGMNNGMNMQSQSHSAGATTSFTNHAGNNPVLQNAGYSNQGPVVNRTGYSTNGQFSSMGMQNDNHQRF